MFNTKNRYVLPTPSFLRGQLLEYNRLYAYPTIPEEPVKDGFVILDSGAYGLSRSGQSMTKTYIKELNTHYSKYKDSNIICVAPDVYLNPCQTMYNYENWIKQGFCKITPVIQSDLNKNIILSTIEMQCKFYKKYNPKFVLFSNPALEAHYIKNILQKTFDIINDILKPDWIHILGAGWSIQDVQNWNKIKGFQSMDSIAYYKNVDKKQALFNAIEFNKIFIR